MFSEIVDDMPADSFPVNHYGKYTFRDLYYSPRARQFYQYNGYVYTIHRVFSYDEHGPCAHVKSDEGPWTKIYVKGLSRSDER